VNKWHSSHACAAPIGIQPVYGREISVATFKPSLDDLGQLVTPLNNGELRVAHALRTLDDEWHIFVQPNLGMDIPDFVAVHPKHGVCAIEVKDWDPSKYENRDGGRVMRWDRNGWAPTPHPLMQPYRYESTIYERHFALPDDDSGSEFVRSILILLNHETPRARALLRAPELARWRSVSVYGEDVLDDLESALKARGRGGPPSASMDRVVTALLDGSPIFELRSNMNLSPNAKDIAENPRHAKMRRVRGAAGSGKSLGIAMRAAQLAEEGKSVLVVSYNITLQHYLRSLVAAACNGPTARRVECIHFHGFCKAIVDLAQAKRERQLLGEPHDHPGIVDEAWAATTAGHRRRYDAILVDEGQDFELSWWNLLREHVAPDGEMLLVVDDTQNIFGRPGFANDHIAGAGFSGPWTTLRDSYRVPGDLVPVYRDFAERFLDGDKWLPEEATPPAFPTQRTWINCRQNDLARQMALAAAELLETSEFVETPRELTFLAPSHVVGESVAQHLETRGHVVHHVFARSESDQQRRKRRFHPDAPGAKGCTIQSFKGWESRVLVVGIGDQQWDLRLAYVALTRLKQGIDRPAVIVVVNSNPALTEFGETFELGVPLPPPVPGGLIAV
jgi:hypothetical protein